jgi:hypothetical protein
MSDWTADIAHADDAAGDVDNPAEDITRFWVNNDSQNLYFRVDTVAGRGRTSIHLDTDKDLGTGNDGKRWTAKGTVGAEYMAAYYPHDGGLGLFKYDDNERGADPVAVLWGTAFDYVRASADGKSFEARLELSRLGLKAGDSIYLMVQGLDFVGVSDWLPNKLGQRFVYTIQ